MHPATDAPPPPVQLLRLITGAWVSQSLNALAEIGVADHMASGPAPVRDLAEKTGTLEGPLYRMLRALASVGVFREVESRPDTPQAERRFELTEVGRLLRSDVPGSMRAMTRMLGQHWADRAWEQAAYCLRTGEPAFDRMYGQDHWAYLRAHPEDSALFDAAMADLAGSMHRAAVGAYDWSRFGTLVDVGGGTGRLLAQVLAVNPRLRGVVFDQAHVVPGAKAVFEAHGVAGRASAAAGSFFESVPAIGAGDAFVMSHILHDWDDRRAEAILRTCRRSAQPGATLLVLDAVVKPGNEPDLHKLIDVNMLVLVGGRERSEADFRALLGNAGWELRRVIPTESSMSIVEAVAV